MLLLQKLKICKWLCNWVMGRGLKNFKEHDGKKKTKNLDFLEEIVSRNMDINHLASK